MAYDSYKVVIYSCCSYSSTTNHQNFVGPMQASNLKIHAGAANFIKWKVTWQFDLEDDDRVKRTVHIPKTLYCKVSHIACYTPKPMTQKMMKKNQEKYFYRLIIRLYRLKSMRS